MAEGMSKIRRLYNYAALLALVHVGASLAVLAYAAVTGGVTTEKLRAMAAVLSGESTTGESAKQPATAKTDGKETALPSSDDASASTNHAGPERDASFAGLQTDLDIIRLETERAKAELDQRLALNNSILLKVASEREAFQRERQATLDRDKTANPDLRGEGFAKQVAIFETLTPKVAIEHLLALPDPDEAARVLVALEPRKAKAVIEAAKREDQSMKMKEILRRVRTVAPDAADQRNAAAEGPR